MTRDELTRYVQEAYTKGYISMEESDDVFKIVNADEAYKCLITLCATGSTFNKPVILTPRAGFSRYSSMDHKLHIAAHLLATGTITKEEYLSMIGVITSDQPKADPIKCECGGEICKLPHSHWCPKHKESV